MTSDPRTLVLAHAVYEMRLLLSGYLGSMNDGPLAARVSAHLSYALHNIALDVIEERETPPGAAQRALTGVDDLFGGKRAAGYFKQHV